MFSTLAAVVLLAVSTVQAIQVTYPAETSPKQGNQFKSDDTWTSTGPQLLKWEFVESDPSNFALLLVNQDASVLSASVLLSMSQATSAGSVELTYPGGTWPVGSNFQVNLIKSSSQTSSILAQSPYFSIVSGSSTVSATESTAAASSYVAPTTLSRASAAVATASQAVYSNAANAGLVSGTTSAAGSAASGGISSGSVSSTTSSASPSTVASFLTLGSFLLVGAFFA